MKRTDAVRRIGIQTRSITGTRPDGNRYESALERDFMELIAGHPQYASYQYQPVWIDYINPYTFKPSRYPPDGLVRWKDSKPPLLVEIKYREDCAGKWRELRAKFRAAATYANLRGWEFSVITEEEIRTPTLENEKFLSGYRSRTINEAIKNATIKILISGKRGILELIDQLDEAGHERSASLVCIWHLISTRTISADWTKVIDMHTPVWITAA